MAPAGVLAANPLSLSVPEPAFESWLRDTGYLEILDERTSSPSSAAAAADKARCLPAPSGSAPSASNTTAPSSPPNFDPASGSLLRAGVAGRLKGPLGRVGRSTLVSVVRTLMSILTINPFAKLSAEDFSGSTPPWTSGFLTSGGGGQISSYSWPAGPSQARMRVHENAKRYARNYASLWFLFFACTLYKMPLALFGLMSSLALWEFLRLGTSWWNLEEKYPSLRFVVLRVAQLATVVILYYCNLQVAVLCAISLSYVVMILHASLRKLTSPKQSAGANRYKRSHQNKK